MRLVEARPVLSAGLVKMEERKRPASYEHDESAPPLKKQATSMNGANKSHPDAEMPWKDELEVSLVLPFASQHHAKVKASALQPTVSSVLGPDQLLFFL